MNIKLHTDKCLSCGTCVAIAPTVFSLQNGVVSLLKDPKDFTPEEQEQAKQAAQMCPNSVIEIIE